jgi:hypothetical protein
MTVRTTAQSRAVKKKGRDTENAWAELLSEGLSRAIGRKRTTGIRDQGDLFGLVDWTLEVKHNVAELTAGLLEAVVEQAHAGTRWHALLLKVQRRLPRYWAVAMTAEQFMNIVLHIEALERENRALKQNQAGSLPVVPIEHAGKRGISVAP